MKQHELLFLFPNEAEGVKNNHVTQTSWSPHDLELTWISQCGYSAGLI